MSDRAPSFRLPGDDGTTSALADHAGKYVVVYFYPRDDTPGCTREAQAFTAAAKDFAARGVEVLGISRDSLERHAKFRSKYELGIKLLSDPELKVHRAYGAFGEKKLYGKTVEGVIRSTFLIDPKGKIAKRYSNVKVDGHVEAVLRDLDAALRGLDAPQLDSATVAKKVTAKKTAAARPAGKVAKVAKKIVKKR